MNNGSRWCPKLACLWGTPASGDASACATPPSGNAAALRRMSCESNKKSCSLALHRSLVVVMIFIFFLFLLGFLVIFSLRCTQSLEFLSFLVGTSPQLMKARVCCLFFFFFLFFYKVEINIAHILSLIPATVSYSASCLIETMRMKVMMAHSTYDASHPRNKREPGRRHCRCRCGRRRGSDDFDVLDTGEGGTPQRGVVNEREGETSLGRTPRLREMTETS